MEKDKLKKWIEELIEKNELWKFYKSKEWITLKNQILKENHYECAICRQQGIITRYDIDEEGNKRLLSTVHHVQYVRKHPAMALSRTYMYEGKEYKNLIPVCKACHNKLHPEKHKKKNRNHFINEERW
jgi:5-methylcytosine-specific restriction endonuclease McrA